MAVQTGLCWTGSENPEDKFSSDVTHIVVNTIKFVLIMCTERGLNQHLGLGTAEPIEPHQEKNSFLNMRKQRRSICAADLRLYFRYTDSTIPLLPKSKFSSL